MENKLLSVMKSRMMRELRGAVQDHQLYRDKVNIYHKFPYKERPQMGVVLRNASGNRIKLSADDHAGTLKSYLALARAGNHEGKFLNWVWEDFQNLTEFVKNEDLSTQVEGTGSVGANRVFRTQGQIVSGECNTVYASDMRHVYMELDGERVLPEYVNGRKRIVILPEAPSPGSTLTVSYHKSRMVHPGRYYIEILSPTEFVIDPFLIVRGEMVIENTGSGITPEDTANLKNGNVYGGFETLYTKKGPNSHKLYLEKDEDYGISQDGLITFHKELPEDTTLYADYRFIGDTLGPFPIPDEFHYDNTSLPGVILSFSNQVKVGDKMVVVVHPDREPSADFKSGHYTMSFDVEVFTRDPMQLAELTDHVIGFLWNERRLKLMSEGITIEELDPTGESEDVYDEATGDLYYKNGISVQVMTEWKKFIPYVTELLDFDTKLYRYTTTKDYVVTNQGRILELRIKPNSNPFELRFSSNGYPRYV